MAAGIELEDRDGVAAVGFVVPGGVAARDGRLAAGDVLVAVEGVACATYAAALAAIGGASGSGAMVEVEVGRAAVRALHRGRLQMQLGGGGPSLGWAAVRVELRSNLTLAFATAVAPPCEGSIELRFAREARRNGGVVEILRQLIGADAPEPSWASLRQLQRLIGSQGGAGRATATLLYADVVLPLLGRCARVLLTPKAAPTPAGGGAGSWVQGPGTGAPPYKVTLTNGSMELVDGERTMADGNFKMHSICMMGEDNMYADMFEVVRQPRNQQIFLDIMQAMVETSVRSYVLASTEVALHPESLTHHHVLRHEDKNSDSPTSPLVSRFASVETSTPPASSGPHAHGEEDIHSPALIGSWKELFTAATESKENRRLVMATTGTATRAAISGLSSGAYEIVFNGRFAGHKLKIHYWALSLFAAIFAMISVSLYIFMRLFVLIALARSPT